MKNIGIIILAAGASRRMGRPKQLLPINGQPLLLHAVDEALSTLVQEVIVVIGSNADTHIELLETYPVHIVINDQWKDGIGSSIKTGLKAFTSKVPNPDAVLFMVGDQPAITFEYLTKMIQAFDPSSPSTIASGYSDTVGVPALFPRNQFDTILSIDDAHGAKVLLQNHSDLHVLHCPEGLMDIDTPEDYEKFKGQLQLGS
jgi:molybdenum cofactor cytidylyltransferase